MVGRVSVDVLYGGGGGGDGEDRKSRAEELGRVVLRRRGGDELGRQG